jgi:hypothetical protein
MQWVLGGIFSGSKGPVREADHSPVSSAEVKNMWSYYLYCLVYRYGMLLEVQGQLYLNRKFN